MKCLFTSDLHGDPERYRLLIDAVRREHPAGVFLGGDLFRHGLASEEFIEDHLLRPWRDLRSRLASAGGGEAPRCFVILGNDDPRIFEPLFVEADREGWIDYVHERTVPFGNLFVTGYAYVPPTPFLLKDWERYDVSRFVDPGCVSPEEGRRTVAVDTSRVRYQTIAADLDRLAANAPPERTIFLFHSPPYGCALDRAALDGKQVDHAPLDVHVGSIAMQRFIAERQPLLTLHGHIHEAPRLTGTWRERFGPTHAFCGCHDGPGLPLVRFDARNLAAATREIVR